MEMPKPSAEQKKLERLAGTWEGEEKVHPSPFDPVGGTARSTVRNVMAVDGFALVQDYEQDRGRPGLFRGHAVVHHDPVSKEYVLQWIDNAGMGASTYRGTFDGDVLRLSSAQAMGHSRATWTLEGADRYGYLMEVSPDGATWHPFLEATYRRRG
jgi:hypothetical protein